MPGSPGFVLPGSRRARIRSLDGNNCLGWPGRPDRHHGVAGGADQKIDRRHRGRVTQGEHHVARLRLPQVLRQNADEIRANPRRDADPVGNGSVVSAVDGGAFNSDKEVYGKIGRPTTHHHEQPRVPLPRRLRIRGADGHDRHCQIGRVLRRHRQRDSGKKSRQHTGDMPQPRRKESYSHRFVATSPDFWEPPILTAFFRPKVNPIPISDSRQRTIKG